MENVQERIFDCDNMISESSVPDEFSLVSKNGQYAAIMQTDGNIVLYKYPGQKVLWSSKTYGKGSAPYTLKLQKDGNLVVFDGRKVMTWTTGTAGKGAGPFQLMMQDDGNLVLRDVNNQVLWGTWTKQT